MKSDPVTGHISEVTIVDNDRRTVETIHFDKNSLFGKTRGVDDYSSEPRPGDNIYPNISKRERIDYSHLLNDGYIEHTTTIYDKNGVPKSETSQISLSDIGDAIGKVLPDFLKKPSTWGHLLTGNWTGLLREMFFHQIDPLALDLNGNGIETLAANGHDGAMFDHERSGIRTATGWVHGNDGILVYDRNGDGKINDGGEIFGDNTLLKNGKTAAHGFEAAAELDDNGDGKLDAADSAFGKLGVWRDLNHNGISEAGEIFTLKDLRIQSLNLGYTQADKDLGNGNTLAEVGSYTDEDGNEHIMGDLHLAADRLHSRYSESIPLTDEQQQEVNLRGSGRLRDLREAVAQSSELAEVLQQYKNAATKEEQLALRDKLLQAWANTDPRRIEDFKSAISTLNTITQGGGRKGVGLTPSQIKHMGEIAVMGFWKTLGEPDPAGQKQAELNRKIAILDAFTGTRSPHLYYFSKKEAQHIVDTVNDTYERLADSLYDGLLFQTRLRPYLDAIRLSVNEEGEYRIDYSGVSALFAEIHKTNPGKAFTDLGELLAKGNADGKNTAMAPLAEQFVQYAAEAGQNGTFAQYVAVLGKKNLETLGHRIGSDGNDNLSGNESANYLAGENGNDTLNGYGGNDILSGGNGNDKLYGGKGHDILSGDAGNDHMQGGDYESDTYLFAKGHGKDSIYDWARNDDEADKIVFNGAKARDAVFGREGADLTIRAYGNEQDQVNIQGFFSAPASNQHHFQFDDATLKVSDIAQKAFAFDRTSGNGWITDDTIHGTAGNDDISGADGNDTLNGNDGDDTLSGDNGDDTLNGGNGNDKLYGGKGHDILNGAAGNDHMQGGDYESDTYLFAKGHGKDSIYDWARNDDEADKIVFNGAKARDAVFGREGADLTIRAYGNEQDQVTIQSYYSHPGQNYYDLQFDDATYDAAALRSRDLLKDGLPSVPVAEEKTAAQTADDVKAEAAPASSAGTIQTAENVAAQAAADTAASAQTVKEAKAETASATAAGTKAVTDSSATAAAPVRVLTTQAASVDSPQGATGGMADDSAAPAAGGAQSTTAASDARATAQAQHLIEAMAAFDTRSATADNLATPPLQQPPLAAADTATVKPLLP